MTDQEPNQQPARSRFHDRLPIGERLPSAPVRGGFIGFDDPLIMKPLEPMLVPEAPRGGEVDATECFHCGPGREGAIWSDDLWHLGEHSRTGLPYMAGLAPNEHLALHELTPALLTSFGGVVQRVAGAIQSLDSVARTHFSRWGDGSFHFHLHFLARPLGMMQGRGAMLAFWDDVLPPLDDELRADHRRQVAATLARGGGESHV